MLSEAGPEREHEPLRWHERGWARMLGALLAVGALAVALLWHRCGLHGCPDVQLLRGYMPDEASTIVDREGREVAKLFVTRRITVPIDSIPELVRNAFIAIEDRRFWEHDGVDWLRVIGAFWTNVKSLDIEEGSSTITMQLARNLFPERLPASQRTPWRKLGEARVAKLIEQRYTKSEILELYLNQIYFGSGAYGIETAAHEYFGKSVTELDLPEAALLAALPRAPSRLNPRANPAGALRGREQVLARMAEQGMITESQAEEAAAADLELVRGEADRTNRAPYYVEAVRRLLEERLGDAIYTEGYTIRTTIDLDAQRVLEEELTEQARAIEAGRYGAFRHPTYASVHEAGGPRGATPYLQMAGIVMDAETGDVLALIGGRDFDDSQFNRATQALRQPGSAFKPFVYVAALAAGFPPTHTLLDEPVELELSGGRVWRPENYGGSYAGEITMREALVHSKNVATVRLANEVGVGQVARAASDAGLGDPFPTNPSVVLGTAEVTPIRLTAAYAAFATLGMRPEPRFVTAVEDRDGNTVFAEPPDARSAFDPAVAFIATSLMQDVVNRGTGTAVRAVGYRGPAAGKTGTTQDAADAWFVGFTPDLVATVWLGLDDRQTIVRGASGGELAAPVWGRVMRRLGAPENGWSPPPGVEQHFVDSYGNIVDEQCPGFGSTRTEFFLAGTAPIGRCEHPWDESWYDSLYYDSIWGDTLRVDTIGRDNWWDRLRARLFGRDSIRRDSIRLDSILRDSIRRDSIRRDSIRRDTLPDTIWIDTIRIPPVRVDTSRPPDTLRIGGG